MKKIIGPIGLIGLIAGLTLSAGAGQGQWDTGSFTLPTALSSPATNTITYANTASTYAIPPGANVTLMVNVQAAGTATTTVTNGFDLYNGSTWTTTQPYQVVTTLNGTTPASGFVQLTAAQLAGFQQIRPDTSSSPAGTNAMTYNSITYSCYH